MRLEGLQLDKYRLLRQVGRGAAGTVYLADDIKLHRQVALKIVQENEVGPVSAAETRRLFEREAKAVAQLDHPAILPLFDFGEEVIQGTPLAYLVTPFCPDGSLAAWLHTRSGLLPMPPADALALIQQGGDALAYAHEHGIVHRDVKPSNFLVRTLRAAPNRPDLLLADFGIARFTNATINASTTIRGTPMYMAPEQWSAQPLPASDQYALATMAYELLTGRPPFTGTQQQIMFHHLFTFPQPPSTVNPRLPSALDMVLLRALAKHPEARYPTVTAFAEALRQVDMSVSHVLSPPPGVIIPKVDPPVAVAETSRPPAPVDGEQETQEVKIAIPDTDPPEIVSLPYLSLPPHRWKVALLTGLVALVVIAGFIGIFTLHPRQNVTDTSSGQVLQSVNATATMQSSIQATSDAEAAATAAVTTNPYDSRFTTLALSEPLTSNTDQQWAAGAQCSFASDGYHVRSTTQAPQLCIHGVRSFRDMTLRMVMTVLKGSGGGVVFHLGGPDAYYFRVTLDGNYALFLCTNGGNACTKTLTSAYSSWIISGLNQLNTLGIVIIGQKLYLYINDHEIDYVNDATSPAGLFGGVAEAQGEVVFSNLEVWIA